MNYQNKLDSFVLSMAKEVLSESLKNSEGDPMDTSDLKEYLESDMPYYVTKETTESLSQYEDAYIRGYAAGLKSVWKSEYQNNVEQRVADHKESMCECSFAFLPTRIAIQVAYLEGLRHGKETGSWYNYCAKVG